MVKLVFGAFCDDPVARSPFLVIRIGASRDCPAGGGYVLSCAGCRIAGAQQRGRAREHEKADKNYC
jgi:hypothetical protein